MKKIIATSLVSVLTMTGCASIISGSTQTLTFKSVPEDSNITITNKAGEKVHTGVSPLTVTLKRGNGFFKSASYDVTFKKAGYQTKTVHVSGTVNGWYIGNILFGGLIGLLIVDPVSGAMYTLNPDDVNAILDADTPTASKTQQSLTVMLLQDIPVDIMKRAELITTL